MVAKWQMESPPITLHQRCQQKEDKGERVKLNGQLTMPPFTKCSQKFHLAIRTYSSLVET